MPLDWDSVETAALDSAMQSHPLDSGRCAALARCVLATAQTRDADAHGLQVRPKKPAYFVVPKQPLTRQWHSHTLVSTRAHAVDAITGIGGCETTLYLAQHWKYPDHHHVVRVDVQTVDPGIENDDA